jgi:UDP-N-acetylglucosamine--N-acetylmuramyl-(pentapeptide) pyrophosphoryl-undecaprenol N-acetylglucosamine transferase
VRSALVAAAGEVPSWWSVEEYVDAMGDLLAAADLVVCRSGATTLAELSSVGRAAILVPYPFATDDHQTRNADPFVEAGAAIRVADADLDLHLFRDTITGLLVDPARRAIMSAAARSLGRPDSARAVADAARSAAADPTPEHSHMRGVR